MGRRATKKVITNCNMTLHQRYIYRGYLQIACCDLTRGNHPCLWLITWDPSQSIATRPLAIQKDGKWYTYGWDLIKNIYEVYGQNGYIRSCYNYAPFGRITTEDGVEQPIQWSSECFDREVGLIYYNYRCYNPKNGNWISRDPITDTYNYADNTPLAKYDIIGLYPRTFKGFENSRYQKHDNIIEKYVNDFNSNKAKYAGCSEEQAKNIPDLDENLLKSMMIQETGGGDRRSRAAWEKDPLQVNVPGDFGSEKLCLGLKKPKKRNEGTLEGNLKAAIMYLVRKGFGRSGKAPCKAATFDGWKDAIRRYNGRTDKVNGQKYSEVYAEKIFKRAMNADKYEKIETK